MDPFLCPPITLLPSWPHHPLGRLELWTEVPRPYIPEGSLRRVLTFPHAVRSDAAIRAAAQRAHLEDVLGRFEQRLDAEADWETVLSRGEKQRPGWDDIGL